MPVAENVLSARDHVQHLLASPRGVKSTVVVDEGATA
jgi:hypothetical protein